MANDRLRVSESTAASAATAADTGVTPNVVAEADENEVDDVALYHDSDDAVDDDSVDGNADMRSSKLPLAHRCTAGRNQTRRHTILVFFG